MYARNAIHSIRANKRCSIPLDVLISSTKSTECKKNIKGLHILNIKSAHYGRFFICPAILSVFLINQVHATPDSLCSIGSSNETVEINHVIDGDTVILKDGRHVRLIGINTPEIDRNGKQSEQGAETARKYLISLLNGHKHFLLQFDSQHFDRYKRTLAHLFLPDGKNIQASLLAEGFATPLTIPPNLYFLDCYLHYSNQAISSQRGLWSLEQYKPLSSKTLGKNVRGYRVITGKVERISKSRSSIWINLTGNAALRIKREDLGYFNESELYNIEGKVIQARGWIYHKNNEFRINIKHRSDMMLIK